MFANSTDPAVILEKALIETYGKAAEINIYNQDRKATLDSFMCYWQIDHMIKARSFGSFPLVENVLIYIDPEEENKERDEDLGGQNLKNEFKLP
jgi:hypothetical protein